MQVSIISPTATPVTLQGRRVLFGLAGPVYYNGFCPFLNWWKTARRMEINRASGAIYGTAASDGGYLDANGDLSASAPTDVTSISGTFYTQPSDLRVNYAGEPFTVKWDGTAVGVTVSGLGTGGTQDFSNLAGQSGTFTVGTLAASANVTITFTVNATNRTDPPRSIRIVQTRYLSNLNNGEIFNPDWLAEMSRAKTLRLMDWGPTNNSTLTTYSQIATESYNRWAQALGDGSQGSGYIGSLPLSVVCALAEQTGSDIHYCIPHLLGSADSDASITQLADYFRDNFPADQVIQFEYSNECWNPLFSQFTYCLNQGDTLWPGDAARFSKWYGYRAAQVMNLIDASFGEAGRSRWRGILGTQTAIDSTTGAVNTAATTNALIGVAKWQTDTASALTVSDLFDELHVTGYFSTSNPKSYTVTAVAREANALVTTSAAHGWSIGKRVTFSFAAGDGMSELDVVTATITAVPSSTTFRIDVDTSAYTALAASRTASFVTDGERFDMIATSESRFASGLESTKYDSFNRDMATACLGSVDDLKDVWVAQRTLASDNGLLLGQYEGGCHVIGNDTLKNSYGTNLASQKYYEFLASFWHSNEIAGVYSTAFRAFTEVGGTTQPAKFTADGYISVNGGWAGVRWWPTVADPDGDLDNPVWKATRAANAVAFLNPPALIDGFTPAALFSSGEAGVWLDAQDLSTMKQETTGASATTAAAVGSPVGSIQSKVGGYWFTAPSASARPTLRQAGNGDYYLEFDGVDDVLILAQAMLYGAGAASVLLDMQGYTGNASKSVFMEGSSASGTPIYTLGAVFSDGVKMGLYLRSDASSERIGNADTYGLSLPLARKFLTIIDTGSSIIGYDNGVKCGPSKVYTRSGTLTLNRIGIGAAARTTNTSFCRLDLYGLAAVGKVASDSDIASAAVYFAP